jgi:ribosomal protein S12 methylthiotransferase accessory factor
MRLGTSIRSRSTASTLTRLRRLLPSFGISRVTDITRLDHLGLPVFTSVRPRGVTLRVHAGKGLLRDEARLGAIMEALELEASERDSALGPEGEMTLAKWLSSLPHGLGMNEFAPRLGAPRTPDIHVPVVRCVEVSSRRRVWIPAELVFIAGNEAKAASLFGASSNGLASGNTLSEATLHALLEVLERDALALNRACDASERIDTEALPAPFAHWAAAWSRAGVHLIVRHVPNEFGLPCFEAVLHEPGSLDVNLARGSGLHLDRDIALARAVTEAAQSRLGLIHGARDDIIDFFLKYQRMEPAALLEAEAQVLASLYDQTRTSPYAKVPHMACESPAVGLQWLLAQLATRGFGHVFRRRITRGSEALARRGLHVVKVIVPRCEHMDGRHVRIGPRLLSRVLARR